MQQGDTDKQVPLQKRVALAVKMAELCHSQGMLTEAADKTVVHGFCRGGDFEGLDKLGILHKEHFQKSLQPGVFDGIHELQDCPVHVLDIALGDRQVISRIILSLVAEPGTADIELKVSLIGDDFSGDIDIVHLSELADSHAVGIPDLCVDRSGLVLESQAFIGLSGPRDQGLSFFAEIYFSDAASIREVIDIMHLLLLSF